MSKKHLKKAIKICGGQTALASKIGVKQGHVYNWLNRDNTLPAEHVIPIERATNGEVSRHDLRPDIYPRDSVA